MGLSTLGTCTCKGQLEIVSLGLGLGRKACTPITLGVIYTGGSPRHPTCPFIPSHSCKEKGSSTAATVLGGSS